MITWLHHALRVLLCSSAFGLHSVPAATLTVPISEDTSVSQSNPAGNYGTGQTLRVAGGGAGNDWNALLKFNVSGVSGTVTNAKLRIYNLDVLAGTVSVFKTANNWTEAAATWSNAPAAPQQLAQLANPGADQYGEWDVTSAITTDGMVSFRLTHTNPGQSQDFRSREFGTTPPQLVITLATPPPVRNTNFAFTRDYTPGTPDTNGRLRSGIELMRLTSYQGKLYAATSMFGDTYGTAPYPGYTGCQVLRKDSSSAEWQVDVSFGQKYLRTDCLEVIRFTHDEFGNALAAPVEMLVAGIWDMGTLPGGTGRFISVAIRNDTNGQWFISQVVPVPDSEAGFPSVRSMMLHRDSVTGAQYLFIGAANGGIFKGVYDATVAGRIRWVGTDEVTPAFGRPQSMAVVNDRLYVSFDYGGITVVGQTGGIYRRTDGPAPSWQQVYRNYNASQPNQNQTFRGLTAVPSLSGPGEAVLGGIEYIPAPLIVRIEPGAGDAAFTELNYWDYFTAVFGAAPLLDNNVGGAALNKCEPFLDPETGATQRFITTNLRHPNDPQTGYNGAYFLLRRSATRYEWCEVPPLGLPAGQQLRGVRTVEKSPFADEPRTYYFGGYGAGLTRVSNTAWIYKGVYRTSFTSFTIDDVPVGATGISYADPEFLSEVNRMVFQTGGSGVQEIWVAELNPLTGLLVSATGKDLLVDTNAAAIGPQFDTTNGPEWGLDREGAAVFYSKRDTHGVVQCWRASNLVPGGVQAAPLTHLTSPDGEGAIMVIARKDASRPTTQFIYRYIPAPRFQKGGPARWADETAPDAVHDFPQFNGAAAAPSWIEGTEDFAYAMFVAPGQSEIARFNTATGTATVLTSHPGAKYNVYAFKAPELNGELLVGCVMDRTRFTVFRSDGTRYVPWADLVPPDPEHPFMVSPEIFQAGGMTYLAVQMSSHSPGSLGVLPPDVDCAMWILGLGKDASHRVARRVDDGVVSGAKAYRFEPEVYVGANEVFLFYNIGNTLRRARTGISVESRLANVSVRSTLAAGQSLILGAVVSGGAKELLIRSAGPALNQFGLAGLVDPRIELYTGGATPAAANDDWPAALGATFGAVGAFPFPAGSRDAALMQTLNRPFTVVTRGTGAGAVLVEAYEVRGDTTARLVNVSVRHQVGRGADILIAGFAVAGSGTKQLLIRAAGPALSQFGVAGVLVDPKLEVFGAAGARLGENDNWPPALGATFAQVGAFALPAASRDAALLINLPAGATYTVQVSGADGGTGEALVEIYEVP